MSDKSGFSTASKLAIANMRVENARKDAIRDAEMAKKDVELELNKTQMADMMKAMKNFQQQPQQPPADTFASAAEIAASTSASTPDGSSRGRGRGRGQNLSRGGQTSGRGHGRGPNKKPVVTASDFLISSQSTRSSQSKKRCEISPEKSKPQTRPDLGLDSDEETDPQDPKKSEQWKIQRSKGFQKDRESKTKANKQSKTSKRNSVESFLLIEKGEKGMSVLAKEKEKEKEKDSQVSNDVDMFDFLEELFTSNTPVVPMPGTTKQPALAPNLDPSKVLDWPKLFPKNPLVTTAPTHQGATPGTTKSIPAVIIEADVSANPVETVEKHLLGALASVNPIEKVKAWTQNSPDQTKMKEAFQDIVTVNNDGAWREELEIELRHEDGESYIGTVTMQEAKYGIYRDGLGFKDFKNFDGVRFTFKGVRTVILKLKEQVNVDEMIEGQYFDFKRSFKSVKVFFLLSFY